MRNSEVVHKLNEQFIGLVAGQNVPVFRRAIACRNAIPRYQDNFTLEWADTTCPKCRRRMPYNAQAKATVLLPYSDR